jgi:DNA-binding LacI/PurR family transcriptional regulator
MPAGTTRTATIRDVAVAAGVSTATVSRFINGVQRFSATTEERLRKEIERLGFSVDPQARSMITGRTRTVGVVILDIRNPHFTSIVKGANRTAQSQGYNLLFVDTGERQGGEAQMLRDLCRRVDGLVVSSRMPEADISMLSKLDKPVVFFGRAGRLNVHSVSTDGKVAAALLARHLLDLGHRRFAYLGYPAARWDTERKASLMSTLSDAGLQLQSFTADAPTLEAGENSVGRVLMGQSPPDAVICYNDLLALGLMHQAQAVGFKVPEQVSVVGFDDIPFARCTTPALTTVDMQSEVMGELALERLIQAIEGELVPFDEILSPRLVVRQSTSRKK